jgi:hypothetical protein
VLATDNERRHERKIGKVATGLPVVSQLAGIDEPVVSRFSNRLDKMGVDAALVGL